MQSSKVSFQLPESAADWAGQALAADFPDGLLSNKSAFNGWTKGKDLAGLRRRLQSLGATRISIRKQKPLDWVRQYKSKFPMQRLGRFVILPEWRRKSRLKPAQLPIVLIQGQAFGTGLHESTRLMLRAIEALSHAVAPQARRRVLDVGAGSGILGFACLRLGWKRAFSVELEEAACEELALNRKLNGFNAARFGIRQGAFPGAMRGRKAAADLVLGNLVTPLLCRLMRPIAAQAKKGGTLLFSGIHTEAEARQVAAAASKAGLKIISTSKLRNWFCLRASK